MTDFALLGAGGFVAERHMRAIVDNGHRLVAAMDPHDAVGVLDRHAPDAHFFVERELFDRHLQMLRREGKGVGYVSVCSPNYLHDAHMRLGLGLGADVICEKPLVLDPRHLDPLAQLERESGRRIFTVLQLRLHPSVIQLAAEVRERVARDPDALLEVDLSYITSRGRWYDVSWKGDEARSGGVAMNIGIHFFDMLQWIFGPVRENVLHHRSARTAAGQLLLRNARVRWVLSIDESLLPGKAREAGRRTHRSLTMQGREVEFSDGFTDLHTATYARILRGEGFGIDDARAALEIVDALRHLEPARTGEAHPLLRGADY